MAADEDLQQQLKGFREQLDQINAALVLDADNEELLLLKANLEELVVLTQQNIQVKDDLQSEVKKKVGSKCLAPFFSRLNQSTSYHNAVIYSDDIELQSDCVLVIFSHPVEIAMVPCPFFLDGRCRFTDEKCKYSHGENCRVAELKEYVAPSYEGLSEGQKVLAKSSQGQLWEYAKIHMVSANCEEVVVQWSNKQVEHLPVKSILPFERDDCEFDNTVDAGKLSQVEDFILKIDPCADKLGAWETHTRGIGSKLMAKMGYIFGTGLGKEAEGRVNPVPIVSYPRGISLDFCQNVQNAKQSPASTPDLNKKKIRKETNMFDIVNAACSFRKSEANPAKNNGAPLEKSDSLQVQGFKIGQRLEATRREISQLQQSLARHQGKDKLTWSSIQSKLELKRELCKSLEKQWNSVQRSKDVERDHKRLVIF